MKFLRLIFLLVLGAGFTAPIASSYAQLSVDEKEPAAAPSLADESAMSLEMKVEAIVLIPEPSTYGLLGATSLCLLLLFRRVATRSSALAG